MTVPRVGCAACPVFRDKHLAVGSWYILTTPDGTTYEFCSGCCLLYFAIHGALPVDLEAGQAEQGGAAA
jgi:hypothetical protein